MSHSENFWSSWQERLTALRNVPPILKIVWRSGPGVVSFGIVARIVAALLPIAIGYIPKLIIDIIVEALKTHGAEVFPVTPYRYVTQTESQQVAATIKDLAAGKIGMIAFTSSPQVERLFAVAKEFGLMLELTQGLAKTPIAAIGPVMEKALAAHGLASAIHPESSFHLKPMINAIAESWKAKV